MSMEHKMTVKCELGDRGDFSMNLLEMIQMLPEENKLELAESLSCSDYVIESVCAQIVEGFTPRHSFWGSWSTAYDAPLQRARALIAKSVENVQKREVEDLERRLKFAQETGDKYREDYFKLYHERAERERQSLGCY
jgi:hypothetical protein